MISEKTYSMIVVGLVVMSLLSILGLLAREYGSTPRGSLPIGV